jgi:hypothetical protein
VSVVMQEEAASAKAATELSVDAAEFRLPGAAAASAEPSKPGLGSAAPSAAGKDAEPAPVSAAASSKGVSEAAPLDKATSAKGKGAKAAAVAEATSAKDKDTGTGAVNKDLPTGHPNGIPEENGIDDRESKLTATANGQLAAPESAAHSESSGERREKGGPEAKPKPAKGGAVAAMIAKLNMESGLKGKAQLPNGLPNGSATGKEEPLLNKDPIVVQANGD